MQTEPQKLEIVQEEVMTEEEVLDYLTAAGVNATHRKYDDEAKRMYQAYLELPLSTLVSAWTHLDNNVKIAILDTHLDEFKKWVKESSDV